MQKDSPFANSDVAARTAQGNGTAAAAQPQPAGMGKANKPPAPRGAGAPPRQQQTGPLPAASTAQNNIQAQGANHATILNPLGPAGSLPTAGPSAQIANPLQGVTTEPAQEEPEERYNPLVKLNDRRIYLNFAWSDQSILASKLGTFRSSVLDQLEMQERGLARQSKLSGLHEKAKEMDTVVTVHHPHPHCLAVYAPLQWTQAFTLDAVPLKDVKDDELKKAAAHYIRTGYADETCVKWSAASTHGDVIKVFRKATKVMWEKLLPHMHGPEAGAPPPPPPPPPSAPADAQTEQTQGTHAAPSPVKRRKDVEDASVRIKDVLKRGSRDGEDDDTPAAENAGLGEEAAQAEIQNQIDRAEEETQLEDSITELAYVLMIRAPHAANSTQSTTLYLLPHLEDPLASDTDLKPSLLCLNSSREYIQKKNKYAGHLRDEKSSGLNECKQRIKRRVSFPAPTAIAAATVTALRSKRAAPDDQQLPNKRQHTQQNTVAEELSGSQVSESFMEMVASMQDWIDDPEPPVSSIEVSTPVQMHLPLIHRAAGVEWAKQQEQRIEQLSEGQHTRGPQGKPAEAQCGPLKSLQEALASMSVQPSAPRPSEQGAAIIMSCQPWLQSDLQDLARLGQLLRVAQAYDPDSNWHMFMRASDIMYVLTCEQDEAAKLVGAMMDIGVLQSLPVELMEQASKDAATKNMPLVVCDAVKLLRDVKSYSSLLHGCIITAYAHPVQTDASFQPLNTVATDSPDTSAMSTEASQECVQIAQASHQHGGLLHGGLGEIVQYLDALLAA